jgi:gliding motility-associated protein GldE
VEAYLLSKAFFPAIVFLLLICSGIISGFEVAFFSLPQRDYERIRAGETRHFNDRHIFYLKQRPQVLLATILLSNNLVNIGLILLMAYFMLGLREFWQLGEGVWTLIETGLISTLLLLFGEISPKVFASYRQLKFLRLFSPFLRLLYYLFLPLSMPLANSTGFLYKPGDRERRNITFQELKHAIDITSDTESPQEEKRILKALVNLNSIQVRSVMRARVDVRSLEVKMSREEVRQRINEYGYSRIPVYEDTLDNIKGILYIKDFLPLLKQDKNFRWQSLIRPPYFVPESKRINRLLNEFKEKRLHIAIVVDEFGGTAGIVTLQDILEEIFGEIYDEFDKYELVYSQLDENTFVFDGKTPLLDVCKIAGIPEESFEDVKGENDSLGGLILEITGRFPAQGEVISFKHFKFEVEAVTSKVIKQVKLTVMTEEPESSDENARA